MSARLRSEVARPIILSCFFLPHPPPSLPPTSSFSPSQREVTARLRSEVASLKRELDEAHSMWDARVEGLKATLVATEQHTHALEAELRMRPTVQQVRGGRSWWQMGGGR